MCSRDDDPTMHDQVTRDGADVALGDVLMFLGTPHRVDAIEPYQHPSFDEGWRIARAAGDFAITLIPGQRYQVAP